MTVVGTNPRYCADCGYAFGGSPDKIRVSATRFKHHMPSICLRNLHWRIERLEKENKELKEKLNEQSSN